jgi:PKD repeat protein
MNGRAIILAIIYSAALSLTNLDAQESSGITISRLPFNTSGSSEISPSIFNDGLIFCSDRRTSGLVERTSFDNRNLYNLYLAGRTDSVWQKPVELKSDRNGLFNNGPFCVAPDGKSVYFTSEIETGAPSKSRKFRNHSGIFIGELTGAQINAIRPFKYNNPSYNVGQPSVSKDGRFLFFSSDMPGGAGGSDIYYCELINNDWSSPVNCGTIVNSTSADNYPFIHPSGRLYFSSNRQGGYGGLDIYWTIRNGNSWEIPVRLPAPVNSASDDFAYTAGADLLEGYFVSNRRRSDDIYEFIDTIIRKASCDTLQQNDYCYEFVEENAVKFDTIPFKLNWKFGDGETASGSRVVHCFSKPGKYLVQLDAVNMVTKEVKVNEKSSILDVQAIEQAYITCSDKAFAGDELKFSADSTNLPGWDISRYYWNFEDESMAEGKNVSKTYKQAGVYNIQLIVTSRTEPGGLSKEACVSKNIVIVKKP